MCTTITYNQTQRKHLDFKATQNVHASAVKKYAVFNKRSAASDEMLKYDESPESKVDKRKKEPRSKVKLMLSLHGAENKEKKKLLFHMKTLQCGTEWLGIISQSNLIILHCKP